jgi:hypothetical protein
MARRKRHYRVLPNAYRDREGFDTGEGTLTDVVDAMERLPESELSVSRTLRPPAVVHTVRGEVLGRRYEILGIRSAAGSRMEVWRVKPAVAGL